MMERGANTSIRHQFSMWTCLNGYNDDYLHGFWHFDLWKRPCNDEKAKIGKESFVKRADSKMCYATYSV